MKLTQLIFIQSALAIFITGCQKYESDLIPQAVISGSPSGGVNGIETLYMSNDTLILNMSVFAVNHIGNFIDTFTDDQILFQSTNGISFGNISNFRCEVVSSPDDVSVDMLFDQSGSVADTDPMNARVLAGKEFVDILDNADEACIHRFSNSSQLVVPFTSDKDALKSGIESLANDESGGTQLYNALLNVISYIQSNSARTSRAIIAFSDGNAQDSNYLDNVISAAQGVAPVIVVVLNSGGTSINTQNQLTSLALNTGGAYIEVQDVTGVISAYNSMAEFLTGSAFVYRFEIMLTRNSGSWTNGELVEFTVRFDLPDNDNIVVPVSYTLPM
jgi:hypothetical protein